MLFTLQGVTARPSDKYSLKEHSKRRRNYNPNSALGYSSLLSDARDYVLKKVKYPYKNRVCEITK